MPLCSADMQQGCRGECIQLSGPALAELAASCLILEEFQGRIEKTKTKTETHWAGFKLRTNLTWPSFSVLGLSEPVCFSSMKKGTGTELT